MNAPHYRALEKMYTRGAINQMFPATMVISDVSATLTLEVRPNYCQALGSMHGAVYFKLLDDSAYFSVASTNDHVLYATANFTVNFTKPVSSGRIEAIGRITHTDGKKVYAESTLYDAKGSIIASGSGLFLPTALRYADVDDYQRGARA